MPINYYGFPPDEEECEEAPVPDGLVVKATQTVIPPDAPELVDQLGKPASVVAVARQLNKFYSFGEEGPIKVKVPKYGLFLIGPEGWCVK